MRKARFASVAVLIMVVVAVVSPALAGWDAGGIGSAFSKGRTIPQGNTPTTSVAGGDDVTVSWAVTNLSDGGGPVAGYVVRRYDASSLVQQSIGASCNGITMALTCTEDDVPSGTWRWTVQPVHGLWSGAESAMSAPTIVAAYSAEVLADGPRAYYRLGEAGAATVAADSSGLGNDATYNNANLTKGVAGALVGDANTAVSKTASGTVATRAASTAPPSGPGSMSIELWFRTTSTGNVGLIGWGGSSAHNLLLTGGNALTFPVGGLNDTVTLPSFAADNLWHHVVYTFTQATSTVRVYYDGVRVVQRAGTINITANTALTVGGTTTGQTFVGSMDEVALYGVDLSPARVAAHFSASNNSSPLPNAPTGVVAAAGTGNSSVSWSAATVAAGRQPVTSYVVTAFSGTTPVGTQSVTAPTTSTTFTQLDGGGTYTFTVAAQNAMGLGPVGTSNPATVGGAGVSYRTEVVNDGPSHYYRIDEPAGVAYSPLPARDYSGNGRDATYATPATPLTRGVAGALLGDSDTAVTTPPAGSNVATMAGNAGLPTGTPSGLTMEAWFRTASSAAQGLMGFGTFGNHHQLRLTGGNTIEFSTGGGGSGTATVPSFSSAGGQNLWHHVVVTYSGTTARVYFDGVLVQTQAGVALSIPSSAQLLVGSATTGAVMNGSLDEVALYPSALSAARVAVHYAASQQTSPVPNAPTNVVASTPANASAQVSWTAATVPPDRPAVASYMVTAFRSGAQAGQQTVNAPATSTSFTGLDAPQQYSFTVHAINGMGMGAPGTSNTVTTTGSNTSYYSTVLADSPTHYYRLDQPTIPFTAIAGFDYSGNGRHLVLGTTGITRNVTPTGLTGDSDPATTSAGTGEIGRTGTGAGLPSGNTAFSLELWFRTSSATQPLAGWGSGTGQVHLRTSGNQQVEYSIGGGATATTGNLGNWTGGGGQWRHLVMTYTPGSPGTVRIYLEGALVATNNAATISSSAAQQLLLGTIPPAAAFLNGTLDEVAVYTSTLSAAQVSAHYAARL